GTHRKVIKSTGGLRRYAADRDGAAAQRERGIKRCHRDELALVSYQYLAMVVLAGARLADLDGDRAGSYARGRRECGQVHRGGRGARGWCSHCVVERTVRERGCA